MKVTGRIVNITPTKVVSEKFKNRDVWVDFNDGKYDQTINIQLIQDNCDKFNCVIGDTADFELNIKGRTWTSPTGETKCFNTLECWRWQKHGQQTSAPKPTTTLAQEEGNKSDDLPF